MTYLHEVNENGAEDALVVLLQSLRVSHCRELQHNTHAHSCSQVNNTYSTAILISHSHKNNKYRNHEYYIMQIFLAQIYATVVYML